MIETIISGITVTVLGGITLRTISMVRDHDNSMIKIQRAQGELQKSIERLSQRMDQVEDRVNSLEGYHG